MISIRSQSEIAFALFVECRLEVGLWLARQAGLAAAGSRGRSGGLCLHLQLSDIYSHPEFLRDQSLSKTNESVRLTLAPTLVEKPAGAVATPPRPKLALTPTETLVPTVARNMRNGLS